MLTRLISAIFVEPRRESMPPAHRLDEVARGAGGFA
jgi:hypothetical protein